MTTKNSVLMKKARESLKGNWGLAIGAFLVVYLIEGAIQSIPEGGGGILFLIIGGPFTLGMGNTLYFDVGHRLFVANSLYSRERSPFL